MLGGKLVFLHILRRRIAYLFVSLNLDDENAVTLLDEEVGAEFAALWMFAFLPGILDGVEADWRILQPGVHGLRVVSLAERTHKPALGHSIRSAAPRPRHNFPGRDVPRAAGARRFAF